MKSAAASLAVTISSFGINQGVGSESLSEFFRAVRLDRQVGSSSKYVQ
ncbi:MAG: hypothetical protein H7237_07895 [Alkalinema sp. FL-bin-369]|nr:hypothetical protein [Leptolyngbyaceae cyanobacterium LF-bin-369]